MEWADGAIFAIETYRSEHGDFPSSLEQVADLSTGPALVRSGYLQYWPNGNWFWIELQEEDGSIFSSCWAWDTRSRHWQHSG
jgi:hypothetical protein